jgi:hypothetical protein
VQLRLGALAPRLLLRDSGLTLGDVGALRAALGGDAMTFRSLAPPLRELALPGACAHPVAPA